MNTFVNGSITSNGQNYTILNLATWVSYQSFRSPYYGTIPVSLVLCQWGFEMGWSLSEFQRRYNPGNIDSLLDYSGTIDPNNPTPGARVSFSDVVNGVTAYAHLLISGYKHVSYTYGPDPNNLQSAVNALNNGYVSGYTGGDAYYKNVDYGLYSYETRRIWATAGYSGMYNTIKNNSSLSSKTFTQSNPWPLIGFSDITFNP